MTKPTVSGDRAPRRRWHPSLRQQLLALVVLFALVAGAGAVYQRASSINDADQRARQALRFRADLAAHSISNAMTLAETRVSEYASLLSQAKSAEGCTVRPVQVRPFVQSHTEIVGPDGRTYCSSAPVPRLPNYAGASWLAATTGPVISGPFRDPIAGQPALVVVAPSEGVGVAAMFLPLRGVMSRLAKRLSGPLSPRFLLVDPAGDTVAASRAIGTGDMIETSNPLTAHDWTLRAETLRADAISGAVAVSNRLFWYLLIAFLVLLLAVQLVYVGMARPIRRLSTAVRDVVPGEVPEGLGSTGPAEVVSLGEAFTTLTQAVRDELAQRRKAQAAHAEAAKERDAQAAMLDLVVQSSPALIYVKDLEGRYLMVNESYERAVGLSEAEVLGRTDKEIDPALDALWRANDLLALEGLYHLEEKFDGPQGTRFYEGVKFPLHDASGTIYAVCGISLDVTEQRNAITATARARDAALAANAAKSAFLATMSHEIRTPMNAVIGMTDLLEQTSLDSQQHEFVRTVRSSGEALLAVINNILDFSKIESGELDLEEAPFALREEVEGCLDLVARQASDKGIDLLCYVAQDCPTWVSGDALRLRQILTNLLSNAVKFTEGGEVLVEVDTEDAEDDHLLLRVSVTDTGIGIPEESRSRLFKSFSQVDASTTRVYGGTGLGLAISRRLAEVMGGTITVTDNPRGQGSRFTVTLRVSSCPETDFQAGRADVTAPVLAGRSVLLVDDNETNLRILELQLTRLGMTCHSATSGRQALEMVGNGLSYDIGILDLKMPVMDGIELGNSLKQLPGESAASPLILLTSIGWRRGGNEHSFAALLTKPVKSTSLRDTLTTFLSGRRPRTVETADVDDERVNPPRRILLAEDNAVNQRVVQLMLKSLGHSVDVVPDGRAAVEAVQSADYDVVLMDVQMPQMDGLEATRRIRSDLPAGRQPHIVALTASALVEDREACAAAGMEAYLTKPIRKRELQAMLDRTAPASESSLRL